MLVGPVDLLVLSFPQENADPGVIAAVQEVVEAGFVTVLDLVFLSRSATGEIREIDVSEKLDEAWTEVRKDGSRVRRRIPSLNLFGEPPAARPQVDVLQSRRREAQSFRERNLAADQHAR